jgi:hypothetical protein
MGHNDRNDGSFDFDWLNSFIAQLIIEKQFHSST